MSSKKKTTQTVDNKTTMTPTNPQQTTDLITGLAGKTKTTFDNLDPYSLVAPADPLQIQASQGAAGLGASSDRLGQLAGGSVLDNLQKYMSPYTTDVVNTSLADYDHGAGQQRAQSMLDLAGDTTFGGSGGSIYRSSLDEGLTRGRGTLSAGLHDQAWQRGTSLAQGDRQTQLAAAQAQGQDQRANIDTQAQMADINRLIDQMRRQAPVTALQQQAQIAGGTPLQLLTGSNGTETGKTVTTTSNPMGQIGGLLAGLGSLAAIPLTGGLSATLGGSLLGGLMKKG